MKPCRTTPSSWHQALLPHQRFSIPLALSPQDQEEDTSSATSFNALFSGSFEFSRFHDKDNALDFDSSSSYLLGLDVVPNPDVPLVTGLRFALTNSHTDFDDGGLTTEGSYDLQLFTLHPYVSWEATDSLSLWASLGYGWGTTDLTIDSIDDSRFVFVADSSDTTSEDTFFSVAASSSLQLWRADTTASFLDTHLQQAASPHNSHTTPHWKRDSSVLPWTWPSSPAPQTPAPPNSPAPSTGSPPITASPPPPPHASSSSTMSGRNGALAAPSSSGQDNRGKASPSNPPSAPPPAAWSNSSIPLPSLMHRTWHLPTSPPTTEFRVQVAYGVLNSNDALLTPYIDASLSHNSNTYTTGLRYALATGMDPGLSASHRQRSNSNNDNRFFLQLRSDL